MAGIKINLGDVITCAGELAPRVLEAADACGYEEMGILNSEVLFLCACISAEPPRRIIESGRARGQSTALMARLFPDAELLSIELEKGTAHDKIAVQRLAGIPNVKLLYGDSLTLLPELVEDGDVVLIDGPKESRGIALCLEACRAASPRMVFLHDTHHGQIERLFTESFWRGAAFSDAPAYVEQFRKLDENCWRHIAAAGIEGWEAPFRRHGETQYSYGPTLAALPPLKRKDARWLLRELRRIGKRFRRWRR